MSEELNIESLRSMLKSGDESSRKLALGILKANSKKIPKKDLVRLYKLVPAIECVKNYKDVCLQLGIEKRTIDFYKGLPKKEAIRALNSYIIETIAYRFNGRKLSHNQDRYYPYFIKEAAGWRFLVSCRWYGSYSGGVVGFYFKNKEDSDYCGEIFIKEYSNLMENKIG